MSFPCIVFVYGLFYHLFPEYWTPSTLQSLYRFLVAYRLTLDFILRPSLLPNFPRPLLPLAVHHGNCLVQFPMSALFPFAKTTYTSQYPLDLLLVRALCLVFACPVLGSFNFWSLLLCYCRSGRCDTFVGLSFCMLLLFGICHFLVIV